MKLIALIFSFTLYHLCSAQLTCGNWLKVSNAVSGVTVGDLDITGNQITIEAICDATGDTTRALVSKHRDPSDVNYFLCPDLAQITTTDGFFSIASSCTYKNNKTYHVALVYDGTTLKIYRNGFLLGSTPATGNLITNDWPTTIGEHAYTIASGQAYTSNIFKGVINEVRIWNVARTQAQLRSFMMQSLPNPNTQLGLLAYYTFNDLTNKQGNAAWNGSLNGAASINSILPNCSFKADSCDVPANIQGISNIINEYTPIISLDDCTNKLTVEDASKYNAGDTVLIIQMKGAVIDSSNSTSFGSIVDYKNAGNYEFNYVKSKSGNVIELKNVLIRQYDFPYGKVQLIRVPYFQDCIINDTLTCLAWDGRKGGVLVLNAANSITMNADINVSGKGFRGGRSKNSFASTLNCANNDFTYPSSSIVAAEKGESIYEIGTAIAYGKGANANGGGGGNGHNSGGGGGGNGGTGGFGGYQLEACGNSPFDNRGFGGNYLDYNNVNNKIFLGGGGGSGHTDNIQGIDMNGGDGGGIAIIMAPLLFNNGYKIVDNGSEPQKCDNAKNNCHDASGGGGSGGTVLIKNNSFLNSSTIECTGAKGGDLVIFNSNIGAGRIGPGGGGGGGVIWFSQSSTPGGIGLNLNGGLNGVIIQDNNNPWGATTGSVGQTVYNLELPIAVIPFKPNIDSVRIKNNNSGCGSFTFNGLAYINSFPISQWQWNFGDGSVANTQNTSHTFGAAGTYNVKLIVVDINGCKDSITVSVIASPVPANPAFTTVQPTCISTVGTLDIISPLGANFQYSINGVNYQASTSFANLSAGVYNITVKNIATNCISAQVPVTISAATPPTSATNSITHPTCINSLGTIKIAAPVGANFQYSIDGINYQASTSFSNLSPGSYNITVKNINSGCISSPVTAVINPPLYVPVTPQATLAQPICNNETGSLVITNPVGANIQYSLNNAGFQTNVNFSNLKPGTYSLIAKDVNSGCSSTPATLIINVGTGTPPSPSATVNSQPDCINTTGSITVTLPSGNNYQFSIDGGSYQSSTVFGNLNSGSHNLTVKNSLNGCISSSTVVTINAIPSPPQAPLTNIIQPTCAVITGTINVTAPSGSNIVYSLNNGLFQPNISFAGLIPGSYNLVAKNTTTQCTSTKSFAIVDAVPLPPSAPIIGAIIQPSCSIQKGTINIETPVGVNLEYNIDGAGYQSSASFGQLNPGTYNFTVRNKLTSCISGATTATINPLPPLPPTPVARVTVQPTCVISSGAITVSSPVGSSYEYSVDGINYQSSNLFSNLQPSTYNITVKDLSIACLSMSAPLTVTANTNTPGTYLIPNAFTPNHDGFNECFGIKYWGVVSDFKLIIYNRWGQTVFSTTNANDCWDGKYKGVAASQGNYVYYIKAKTLCGPVEKKGNVLLIR